MIPQPIWRAAERSWPHLQQLEPATRLRADYMLRVLWHNQVPLWISNSRRTEDEQRRLVASGASRTMNSKHLSGQAFDVDVIGYGRDAIPGYFWDLLGPFGESLGLVWGGRWPTLRDYGHFELAPAL